MPLKFLTAVLQLIGFATGCAGCFLSMVVIKHPEWKLWIIDKTDMYKAGITRIGIWKICFPPNLKGAEEYSVLCCHNFAFFDKFFPVEMKVAQILTTVASVLAFLGLVFLFLTPWNIFFRNLTRKKTRWLLISGGILYLLAGICILVPISWSVHSVSTNKSIPFPSSFSLPLMPIEQRNGDAIYLGFMSGILLLASGICIILQGVISPRIIIPI
uniref:Uncharacterized protein n=1 Tax=Salvator merianae TaxID=96440 RepID=A0A8D0ECF8_SALMN